MEIGDYETTVWVLQRMLAALYFNAFLVARNQNIGLLGENGILPINNFVKQTTFRQTYSLLHFFPNDRMLTSFANGGLALSFIAFIGLPEALGYVTSFLIWFLMWVLYLSINNIGQRWYSFGWEMLLLEAGFLAIFLGPSSVEAPVAVMWLYRWLSFRVMFGAGLIKLRGDPCWWDFTCLDYHYETQPIPNPLSRWLHNLPKKFHHFSVGVTHFVELVVPFFLLVPGWIGYIGGVTTILFQVMLIVSGNLAFLNYITIAVTIPCFDDRFWRLFYSFDPVVVESMPLPYALLIGVLTLFIIAKSIKPTVNLFSNQQLMNFSYDPLHLVNTYGAFGSVTKRRCEIIVEGSYDGEEWREYHFKAKPGNVRRRPPVLSPYHRRLDWLMWFAGFGTYQQHPWFLGLVLRLFQGNRDVLALMDRNPFPGKPPKFIRARRFLYQFAPQGSEDWWMRRPVGEFLPPVSLDHPQFREICMRNGWL